MSNRVRVRRASAGVWHVERLQWRLWFLVSRHSSYVGAIRRADDVARRRRQQSDYILAGR